MQQHPPPPREDLLTEPDPVKKIGTHVLHRVLGADAAAILKKMHELTGTPKFPGPNPISLEKKDLQKLRQKQYYACEKTDGVRHAFFACTYKGHNVAVVVDRRLTVWLLPLRGLPRAAFQGTVLDGEIALNTRNSSEPEAARWQFLTFDAVWVSGVPAFALRFMERIAAARKMVGACVQAPDDVLALRVKNFVDMAAGPESVDALRAHLDMAAGFFACDGIVFTPDDQVAYGRHMDMFKFKDSAKHTVDFLVLDAAGGLGVWDPSSKNHASVGRVAKVNNARMPPRGAVVECSLRCARSKTWNVVMQRLDKNEANDMLTFQKTLVNIRENLSFDDHVAPLFTAL
jgi:hypothetical protein